MKRKISIILCVAVCFFTLCACSSSVSSATTSSEPESTATSTEEQANEAESTTTPEPTQEPTQEPTPEPTPEERDGDFRSAFWGDDIETVKKYEASDLLSESESRLCYGEVSVASKNFYAIYIFDSEGKLYQGMYYLTDTHTEGSMYISDYTTLKEALTSVYGTPTSDVVKTLNSAASATDDGKALEFGWRLYNATWENENTTVNLLMGADNYEIMLYINYEDKNHEKVINSSGL
jgi:hypothetical protein